MAERKIFLTDYDRSRLEELLKAASTRGHKRKDLESLAEELDQAEVVSPEDMPPYVVTMNTKVVLRDVKTLEKMVYTLVFPKDANIEAGTISVLAPVGTAILGYAKGDIIEWPVPSGVRCIRIEDILYQPEAEGDFHL